MKTLLGFLLLFACQWAQAQDAGRIEHVEGDVRLYDSGQKLREARVGEVVREGDSIVTGADGEVHLAMEDEGQIAVRPNTRMRIAKYRAEGGNSDASVIALVQGALRSITGWIGKYNPKGYVIRTPTATIGVRGTDHETMVVLQGSGEGEAGTYDKVNQGATVLSTKHGTTEVRPNQAGFASLSGKSRPRVLASVPGFFRPARLDGRFSSLHDQVRQQIDTRRTQRIEAIRERRLKEGGGRDAGRPEASQRQQHLQEQRREHVEQRRQEQQRQIEGQREERRKRQEEQRLNENRRQQWQEGREHRQGERLQERRERSVGQQEHFQGGRGGEGRGGGAHPGAGRNH